MASVSRRPLAAPLVLLAAGASLSLTGCLMPPPLPTAAPAPQPTAVADAATPTTPATAAPADPGASAEDLPELLTLNTPLAPGTLPGWETSVVADGAAFAVQPDSDFPVGPTISVVEIATGCAFWAHQGEADSDSTDEVESTHATLYNVTQTTPEDWEWEPDVVPVGPSASQGVTVEFLSLAFDLDDGGVEAWFARNFQSSGTTSTIRATCPADAGGLEHIDAVVAEQFRINFQLP